MNPTIEVIHLPHGLYKIRVNGIESRPFHYTERGIMFFSDTQGVVVETDYYSGEGPKAWIFSNQSEVTPVEIDNT